MTSTPYGKWALTDELGKLSQAQQGRRNHTLNEVWFKLSQLVTAGHLDRDDAWRMVFDTARSIGLDEPEIRRTMDSAEKGGQTKPRGNMPEPNAPVQPGPGHLGFGQPGSTGAADVSPSTQLDVQPAAFLPETFWSERSYLDHIRRAAWSRGRSAEAVLGAVLARVAADTPHTVKLPPIVGARCGLTMMVALTGPPGSGKSSAKSIATELCPALLLRPECDDVSPGSGEGLLEIMFDYELDPQTEKMVKKQLRFNAFIYVDEGEVLAMQARRTSSSTILPTLRSAFTDAVLGQANASAERRRRIPGGAYVYGVVLGIQPGKAADLMSDAGGGTPQRFLWMPTNTDIPPPGERPEWPGALDRSYARKPQFGGIKLIHIPPDIEAEVQQRDHQRQLHGCDPLDEHSDLIRLKVAAMLAVLDNGRFTINPVDWKLSEEIMQVSAGTRARVQASIAKELAEANRARGESEAQRQQIVDDKRATANTQRVAQAIMRKLDSADGEWITHGKLRVGVTASIRADFDPVIENLVDSGLVEVERFEYKGQESVRYRRTGKHASDQG